MTDIPSASTETPDPAARARPRKIRKNPQRRQSEYAKAQAQAEAQAGKADEVLLAVQPQTRPPAHRAQTAPPKAAYSNGGQSGRATARPKVTKTKSEQKADVNAGTVAAETQQLTSTNPDSAALAPAAAVTGGLLGCVASAAVVASAAIWREYGGADAAILAVKTAKLCLDNVADDVVASLKAGTYSNDEALDVLRRTTLAYASTIPGGTAYVERVFRELDLVRRSRGAEVNKVLKKSYAELATAARKGVPADEMRGLAVKQLDSLAECAGSSLRDVVDRNPHLKPYRDGMVKSLQGSPVHNVPTVKLNFTIQQKMKKATG